MAVRKKARKKTVKKAVKKATRKRTQKPAEEAVVGTPAVEQEPKLVTAIVAFAVAYGHDVKIPSNATMWVGNQESLLPVRFIPTDTENLQAVVDGIKQDLQGLTNQTLGA